MNRIKRSQQVTSLQRASTAAFLLLAGAVLLAGVVTLWLCYQLPSLGFSWTLDEGLVTVVDPNGPAAGVLKLNDKLLTLNGQRFVPGGDVIQIMHTVRPGQPAEVLIERDGVEQTLTIVPTVMDWTLEEHLLDYAAGVALWGLGLYVFLKRAYSTPARLFLLLNLTASLGLWGNVSLFVDPWYAALRRLALSVMIPCLFTSLVTSLPYDRWSWQPFLRLRLGYYGLSLLLGLAGAITALFVIEWSYPLYLLILGNQIVGFAVAVILLIVTYHHLPRGAARDRYRGAVTLFLLGVLPFVSMVMLGLWQQFRAFDPRLVTTAAFALPFALAYVVLRYQFLGVRVAIQQGLTIVLMLVFTVGTLLTAYVVTNSLLSSIVADRADALAMTIAALTVAAFFEPTRRFVQRQLEHVLDRRSVELYGALESFSRELATLQDLPSLLDSLTHQLEDLFPRTRLLIMLRDEVNEAYRAIRTSNPTHADQTPVFPIRGVLAQQLGRGDVLLPHQWISVLEHLPLEERNLAERLQPEVVIPLLARRDDLLGWIALGAQGGSSSYNEREIALLVGIASQASIAIANAQLYDQAAQMVRELRETNRQLAALQEIGASLTGHLSSRDVLQGVLQGVLNSGDYSTAALGIVDEAQTTIKAFIYSYVDPRLQAQIQDQLGQPIEGSVLDLRDGQHPVIQAIRQGRVQKLRHLWGLPGVAWGQDDAARAQRLSKTQMLVLFPLRTSKDLVGLLVVGTQRPDVPESEIDRLRTFAHQTALAIENARLWEETDERLRQRVRELVTLNVIAQAVNSTLNLTEVLDRALTRTLAITPFDMGAIALLDETGRLQPTTSQSVPPPILDLIQRIPPDTVEQVVRVPHTVVDDIERTVLPWARAPLRDAGLQAFCIVPLVSQENPVGVLGLGMHQEQALSDEAVALAKAVAQQVSIAIANARLYEEAAEEKQKTKTVLQSVGDGVCTTDRELTLLSLNPAAERLLGWQEREVIGHRCSTVLQCHDADEEPSCETACPLALAMQEQRYEYSRLGALFVRSRSGQRTPIWGVAGPLTDPAGAVLGGVMAFRDASHEAEMERLQSEFLSMISHEVRAPLTNLKVAAQTIIRSGSEQDDETRANLARIIAGQCDRLDRLVQQVEDTAQLEAGRLDLQIVPFYLPPLAHDIVQPFQSREKQRTFKVIAADESALWVMGDEDKIGTVLKNLLDNAVKYSQPQGAITVELSLWDANQVLVSVIDEGPCIPADQRDRVFQRFHRIDNTDARSVYGLGLGLYITRELVIGMGGQIWVDEVAGSGNRFCFTLPRSTESLTP